MISMSTEKSVAYALDTIPYKKDITLDDVLAADKAAREIVLG